MHHRHDMPFGASLSDGGVTFRLWGPAAKRADVAIDAGPGRKPSIHPAEADAQGWWECRVEGAGAGTLYQWRIDGSLLVPDPASRQNPLGVHAPSCVVDPLQFEWDGGWMGRPWSEVVLYELHVGTFTPDGTYEAAVERLAELARLGITAIQLMPVAAFPGRFGWGYDGVLPFAPFAPYGTPDDLKHFIQAAHREGLMVFMDVVYNHFGPDGNYLHRYAPGFFSTRHKSPWGAAINFDGPQSEVVRDFVVHNALYWTQEFRIDGLRLDAVHAIRDRAPTHILEDISSAVRAASHGRHVHLVLENEDNQHARLAARPGAGTYDAQWNDDFHHALHVALTGETHRYYHDYGREPLNLLARSLTNGMLFEESPRHEGGARHKIAAAPAQPLGAMVNFSHNHDQVGNRAFGERLRDLAPPGAAPLTLLLTLLTPATPMLFMGEERGSHAPFLYFADWDGYLLEAVREGRRREFGHEAHARDGRPLTLPDPCGIETFETSRPESSLPPPEEEHRWRDLVHDALSVRRTHITPRQAQLQTGAHTAERVGETGLRVSWRYADGTVLRMDANLGPQPVRAPEVSAGAATRLLYAHAWPAGTPDDTWPAWSARWHLGQEP